VPVSQPRQRAIFARRVFTGTAMLADRFVVIADGVIAAVQETAPSGIEVLRLADDAVLSPGFVDLQVNGGGGVMFNDEMDSGGLACIAAAHRRAGTTSILPTVISGSREQLRTAMEIVAAAIRAGAEGIIGLHLEGPFLNPERRGIHPQAAITALSAADLDLLCEEFPARLLVTLAPEKAPAGAIARLAGAGRIVFAGHTACSFAQAGAALDQGLAGFTHLFNAMSQLTAREPGAVGAALTDRRARAGIVLDGLHVHPAAAQLAFSVMGPGRLFLVSDAMATAGSAITEFGFAGKNIRLADGRLTDDAGTLAGAHLTMAEAVRNAVHLLGCGLEAALRMATSTPASCIGLGDRIGHISTGYAADMVALDAELHPIGIWVEGRAICPAPLSDQSPA
jgi:N-acetylglucosamine-6-phosphate deacetylase